MWHVMTRFFLSEDVLNGWKCAIEALSDGFEGVGAEWASASVLQNACGTATEYLGIDIKTLENQGFMFPDHKVAADHCEDMTGFLRLWHTGGRIPSLLSMAIAAMEVFGVQDKGERSQVLCAAALGDVENDLPYHSNIHFKKVLLQLVRLISVHNSIYGGTKRALDEHQISLLLIAGCVHDLGHDGLGNTVKGMFYPSRLERQSFDFAKPWLKSVGLSAQALSEIEVMILSTDVTPPGNVTNPTNQMKAAYRFHFSGDSGFKEPLNLSESLESLEESAQLTNMACLLHEADIATSAGVNYAVTKFETCLLMEEVGGADAEARPALVLDFLDKICQRRFLSDAGQKLFGANLARIYALAEKDDMAGNHPYPRADETQFILNKTASDDSKTLN